VEEAATTPATNATTAVTDADAVDAESAEAALPPLPLPAPQPTGVARKLVPLTAMGMMRSRFSPQSRLASSSATNATNAINAATSRASGIETSPATNAPSSVGPRALPQLSPLTLTVLGQRAVPPVANIGEDEDSD